MNRLEEVQTQIYVKLNAVRLGDARPIPRHRRMKLAEMSRLKREFETGVTAHLPVIFTEDINVRGQKTFTSFSWTILKFG
ncbi:hypothetical protein ACOMHN_048770 [Nucella lapillus]